LTAASRASLCDCRTRRHGSVTRGVNGKGETATDESVEDTLIDAANYAVIGLMLGRGWWGLPMEAEE